jgi:hypothetical protein
VEHCPVVNLVGPGWRYKLILADGQNPLDVGCILKRQNLMIISAAVVDSAKSLICQALKTFSSENGQKGEPFCEFRRV